MSEFIMTLVPFVLEVPSSTRVRSARTRVHCAAVIVFCVIAFLNANASAQNLFIYRDLNTGIYSDVDQSVSLRFMRHIWIVGDSAPVMATVIQKGGHDGQGLALYKSLNEGGDWLFERVLSSDINDISDGVLDSDGNLYLVTSRIGSTPSANVNFIKLIYEPTSKGWTLDPLTPVAVVISSAADMATRASISIDSNGVIWCAFRVQFYFLGIPGFTQIKVYYSADGGYTWVDSGNRFGAPNRLAEKSAKVIAAGSRTAVVYQDLVGLPPNTKRYKSWAYREDNQPLQSTWTNEIIAQMVSATDDTVGSHWSVAADGSGNLHLSYQDAGIRYLKYDATAGIWNAPVVVATAEGSYNNISVAGNNDIYLFNRFTGVPKVYCKQYSAAEQRWGQWLPMSSTFQPGYLRMCSPETFAEHLPLLYETNVFIPHEMLYVLFDTSALDACR